MTRTKQTKRKKRVNPGENGAPRLSELRGGAIHYPVTVLERCLEGGYVYYAINRPRFGKDNYEWHIRDELLVGKRERAALQRFEESQARLIADRHLEETRRLKGQLEETPMTEEQIVKQQQGERDMKMKQEADSQPVAASIKPPEPSPVPVVSSHSSAPPATANSPTGLVPAAEPASAPSSVPATALAPVSAPAFAGASAADVDDLPKLEPAAGLSLMTSTERKVMDETAATAAPRAMNEEEEEEEEGDPDEEADEGEAEMEQMMQYDHATAPTVSMHPPLPNPPPAIATPAIPTATGAAAASLTLAQTTSAVAPLPSTPTPTPSDSSASAVAAAAVSSQPASAPGASGAADTSRGASPCSICLQPQAPDWCASTSPLLSHLPAAPHARLTCHTCGVTVHAACYGVTVLPHKDSYWWCAVCDPSGLQRHEVPGGSGEAENQGREEERLREKAKGKRAYEEWKQRVRPEQKSIFDARRVQCTFCQRYGGAILPLAYDFTYSHVQCARFLPARLMPEWPQPPYHWLASNQLTEEDTKTRSGHDVQCCICESDEWSFCVKCAHKGCKRRFHAACAMQKGWRHGSRLMPHEKQQQNRGIPQQMEFFMYCDQHAEGDGETDIADEETERKEDTGTGDAPSPPRRRLPRRRRALLDSDSEMEVDDELKASPSARAARKRLASEADGDGEEKSASTGTPVKRRRLTSSSTKTSSSPIATRATRKRKKHDSSRVGDEDEDDSDFVATDSSTDSSSSSRRNAITSDESEDYSHSSDTDSAAEEAAHLAHHDGRSKRATTVVSTATSIAGGWPVTPVSRKLPSDFPGPSDMHVGMYGTARSRAKAKLVLEVENARQMIEVVTQQRHAFDRIIQQVKDEKDRTTRKQIIHYIFGASSEAEASATTAFNADESGKASAEQPDPLACPTSPPVKPFSPELPPLSHHQRAALLLYAQSKLNRAQLVVDSSTSAGVNPLPQSDPTLLETLCNWAMDDPLFAVTSADAAATSDAANEYRSLIYALLTALYRTYDEWSRMACYTEDGYMQSEDDMLLGCLQRDFLTQRCRRYRSPYFLSSSTYRPLLESQHRRDETSLLAVLNRFAYHEDSKIRKRARKLREKIEEDAVKIQLRTAQKAKRREEDAVRAAKDKEEAKEKAARKRKRKEELRARREMRQEKKRQKQLQQAESSSSSSVAAATTAASGASSSSTPAETRAEASASGSAPSSSKKVKLTKSEKRELRKLPTAERKKARKQKLAEAQREKVEELAMRNKERAAERRAMLLERQQAQAQLQQKQSTSTQSTPTVAIAASSGASASSTSVAAKVAPTSASLISASSSSPAITKVSALSRAFPQDFATPPKQHTPTTSTQMPFQPMQHYPMQQQQQQQQHQGYGYGYAQMQHTIQQPQPLQQPMSMAPYQYPYPHLPTMPQQTSSQYQHQHQPLPIPAAVPWRAAGPIPMQPTQHQYNGAATMPNHQIPTPPSISNQGYVSAAAFITPVVATPTRPGLAQPGTGTGNVNHAAIPMQTPMAASMSMPPNMTVTPATHTGNRAIADVDDMPPLEHA